MKIVIKLKDDYETEADITAMNKFLLKNPEFECCFVCGNNEYAQLYIQRHLYRICKKCLKTNKNGTTTFLRELQKGKTPEEANMIATKIMKARARRKGKK